MRNSFAVAHLALALAGGVAAFTTLGPSPAAAAPSCTIGAKSSRDAQLDVVCKLKETSQEIVWRIDQPNILHPVGEYNNIQFLPGDKFKILAGGCDQTGGSGNTWKRYVNPQGPNTDHLYHGLIKVYGALPAAPVDPTPPQVNVNVRYTSMSRLSDFGVGDGLGGGQPVEHYIPDPLPSETERELKNAGENPPDLILGFEDDNYGDNGYYSRDDGVNGQCVNVPPAYLIISIAHHGAIPPDPRLYVGIKPSDFDCEAGWAFDNEGGTPELSLASFETAFNLSWDWGLNAFNWVLYGAGEGMASNGNCAGMSFMSVVGEDQFVVDDLTESFWHNYRYTHFNQTPSKIQNVINVGDWSQLSGYFVHNWLESIDSDASTITSRIEHDLTSSEFNYNYGLLTLSHGSLVDFTGHVVVPLAVTHSGDHTYIQVYNPNRPCPKIPNAEKDPMVDIVGNNWSFDMGPRGVWTGTNGGLGLFTDGMGYIPYHGPDDGWTDQIASLPGLWTAIFGDDVSVDQVSDSKGRKLIVNGKVDATDKGLGRSVVRLPSYAAAETPKRPRSGDKNKVFKVNHENEGSAAQQALLAEFDKDYVRDYEKSGLVYVVRDKSLTDLTFTLSSKKAGKPVRAAIGQGGQFFEVKSLGASASDLIHLSMTVHSLADLAKGGLTLSSSDSKAVKVTFTYGLYDNHAKTETLQRSSEIAATTAVKARITSNELELLAAGSPTAVTVSKETVTADAKVTNAPVRQFTTEPIK